MWAYVQLGIPNVEEWSKLEDARARLGVLTAARWSQQAGTENLLPAALRDQDPDVQLGAVRWVADEKLKEHRAALGKIAADAPKDSALAKAVAAALLHLK